MALSSMTGFARRHGVSGSYAWAWEIKSVNGKGLDLRLRLPPGWDAIEVPARTQAAEKLARGSLQANLTLERTGIVPVVRINTAVLEAVLTAARQLARRVEASPPSLDGLLALKGVIEVGDAEENEEEKRSAETAAIAGFAETISALVDMRRHEGAALGQVLTARLAILPRSCNAPNSRRAGGRRPYGRGLRSRSRRCWRSPIVSIRTGCIRKQF